MRSLFFVFIVAFVFIACNTGGDKVQAVDLKGFWQGEFKPDPTMKMVFYFWEDGGTLKGNSFISSKDSIVYEDPVIKISLQGSSIEFDIPTQGIHFEGKISQNPLSISGKSFVPGGNPLELTFSKESEVNIWHAKEIIERCNKLNLN